MLRVLKRVRVHGKYDWLHSWGTFTLQRLQRRSRAALSLATSWLSISSLWNPAKSAPETVHVALLHCRVS